MLEGQIHKYPGFSLPLGFLERPKRRARPLCPWSLSGLERPAQSGDAYWQEFPKDSPLSFEVIEPMTMLEFPPARCLTLQTVPLARCFRRIRAWNGLARRFPRYAKPPRQRVHT